ncbi:MAG: type IV pili twitching motility protein PilT [Deltaproteobacteria bacterium RIFOXYD12_FULL_50_9]|nr:MAG: type IV pili twitching motility protein PilT [Deltaproteobacteria bacterium RIFOXYD12_FULL_50_9]
MAVLDKIFKAAVDSNASDIHVIPGEPFIIRKVGKLIKLKSPVLTPDNTKQLISEILTEEQRKILSQDLQLDFAIEVEGLGRFRGSAMQHNRGLSAVFRVIPPRIPALKEVGLPEIILRVLDNHQGLILVTGPTGHGKSTTLAAIVDYINTNRAGHVLTIEDPIEFVHPLKKGVVNQRQLGRDTLSYGNSLKGALREDPDVIVVGELRDLDTIALAISASETGHLVIGTLATSSAHKTVDKIIDSFPPGEQNQIRAMLGEALKAVITQRLIPGVDGSRMELACEILIGTLSMANLIRDNKTYQIPSLMQTGKNVGMRLLDDSILELLEAGKITGAAALFNANNKNLFKKYATEPVPPAA